jgi:hypothetical protein
MIRFILIFLAFYLLFRVVQGIVRSLSGGQRQSFPRGTETPDQQAPKEPPEYRDVRDASFKDIPNDESKES